MSDLNLFYPPISKSVKVNQFKIVDVKIKLFESAKIIVFLYDMNDSYYDARYYELTTDVYLQWSSDDSFLTKYVKMKLQEECDNNT